VRGGHGLATGNWGSRMLFKAWPVLRPGNQAALGVADRQVLSAVGRKVWDVIFQRILGAPRPHEISLTTINLGWMSLAINCS
jgi:hypothetical protein